MRRQLVLALRKAVGRDGETDSVHDELIARVGTETLDAFNEQVLECEENTHLDRADQEIASSLYMLAWTLTQLGRADEANTVFAELVERFDGDEDSSIRAIVEQAREGSEKLNGA